MASDPNQQIDRNPVEARQGSTRPKVFYVLIGGLVLVIAAFAIIWLAQGKH